MDSSRKLIFCVGSEKAKATGSDFSIVRKRILPMYISFVNSFGIILVVLSYCLERLLPQIFA